MRYSLAQLLLEDLRARVVTGVELPSEEEAARTYLVNTYRWLKGGITRGAGLVFNDKALALAYKMSPSVRDIVDEAREIAKQREQDVETLKSDTSFCDYLWSYFNPTGAATDADRTEIAWCLRYIDTTVTPPKLKIKASTGQSDTDFQAEIALGCRQMKVAAAVAALNDLDNTIGEMNAELSEVADEALLTRIRQGLSSEDAAKAPVLDLRQDRIIGPALQAARKSAREMRKLTSVRGRGNIFDLESSSNTIRVTGGVIDRASLVAGCGRPPNTLLPESYDRSRVRQKLLSELDMGADGAAGSPDPAVSALPDVPAPTSLDEAIRQLLARYPSARKAEKLLKNQPEMSSAAIMSAADLLPSIKSLMFRFPKESGELGSSTQLKTQGGIPIARLLAGLIILFMYGARNEHVQPEAVQLVASALRIPIRPDEIKHTVKPHVLVQFLTKNMNDVDVVKAVIYVFCALGEFASKGAASQSLRIPGKVSFSSYSQASLDHLLTFYRVKTLAREQFPETAEGVILVPGVKREPWIDRMMGLVKSLVTKPEEKSRQRVIRSLAPPDITFDTSDPASRVFMQPPDSPESQKRAQSADRVKKTINLLLKEATAAAVTLRRTTIDALKTDDVIPGSSTAKLGAYLGMIEFCNDIAQFSRESHMRGFLQKMGYSSRDSLLMRDDVQGIDVWKRLCDLTGASQNPPVGYNPDFKHSATEAWKSQMTGDNKLKAMLGVKMLLMADFISPILRCARHAAVGYGPEEDGVSRRGLLTDDEVVLLVDKIDLARNAIARSLKHGAQPSASPQRGIAFRPGKATLRRDAVKISGIPLEFGNFTYQGFNSTNPLLPIIHADTGDIVDTEIAADPDAPRVVDPQEYAPQAAPSVRPAPSPSPAAPSDPSTAPVPPAPDPGAPPPAAPSPAPSPSSAPQTPPASGSDEEFTKAYKRALTRIDSGAAYDQTAIGANFKTMRRVTDKLLRTGVILPGVSVKLDPDVRVSDDGSQSVRVRVTIRVVRDGSSAGPDADLGPFDLYGNQGPAISDYPGKIELTTKDGRNVTVQDLVDKMMDGLKSDVTRVMPDTVNVHIGREASHDSSFPTEDAEDGDDG